MSEKVLNPNCPCDDAKCERHGDCTACKAHHSEPGVKSVSACERIARKKAKSKEDKIKAL